MTQLSLEAVCMIELFHLGFVFNLKIDSTIEQSKIYHFFKAEKSLIFKTIIIFRFSFFKATSSRVSA